MLSFIYNLTFKHTSHSKHSIHPFIRRYANRIRPASASRNQLPGSPIKCQNTLRHHKMLEILKSFKSLSVLAFFQNCGKRLKNELLPAKEDVCMLPFCVAQSDSYPNHLFLCVISFISVNILASAILRRKGKTPV